MTRLGMLLILSRTLDGFPVVLDPSPSSSPQTQTRRYSHNQRLVTSTNYLKRISYDKRTIHKPFTPTLTRFQNFKVADGLLLDFGQPGRSTDLSGGYACLRYV